MKNKKEELTIITSFFDIGRKDYKESPRTNKQYLEYFKFWARIKNNLIIYTDNSLADEIKKIREEFGLLDKTKIVIIEDITKIEPEIYKKMVNISKEETFLNFRYTDNSADNNAKYDYVMLLKAWCINDAVNKGYAKGLLAWLDFGFNHGGEVYINPKEFDFLWETDAKKDKITLFSIKDDDNMPIFKVIQSYETYIMGAPYFVPSSLANLFWQEIRKSMENLLNIGFIDDDQTLLLMTSRTLKDKCNIKKSSWFMPLKENGGEHLTIKKTTQKKKTLKDKIIIRLRVFRRNRRCLKRLKRIFFKNSIE